MATVIEGLIIGVLLYVWFKGIKIVIRTAIERRQDKRYHEMGRAYFELWEQVARDRQRSIFLSHNGGRRKQRQ